MFDSMPCETNFIEYLLGLLFLALSTEWPCFGLVESMDFNQQNNPLPKAIAIVTYLNPITWLLLGSVVLLSY